MNSGMNDISLQLMRISFVKSMASKNWSGTSFSNDKSMLVLYPHMYQVQIHDEQLQFGHLL